MKMFLAIIIVFAMAAACLPYACADDMFAVETNTEMDEELDPGRGVGEWDDDTGGWVESSDGVAPATAPLFEDKAPGEGQPDKKVAETK